MKSSKISRPAFTEIFGSEAFKEEFTKHMIQEGAAGFAMGFHPLTGIVIVVGDAVESVISPIRTCLKAAAHIETPFP